MLKVRRITRLSFFRIISLLFVPFLATCSLFEKDRNTMDNVDLAGAIWLAAEPVKTQVNNEGVPVRPGNVGSGGSGPVTPVDAIFNLPPGRLVNSNALMGTIDPTGTNIVNDFDGDGILNQNETLTNVWVADYPQIETTIAPPVTLKIQILKNSSNQSDQIVSEINSNDFEASKNEGSEKIHQNELNERTVQFQDSFSTETELGQSHERTMSAGMNSGFGMGLVSVGMNYSNSTRDSWNAKNAVSATTTKWADRPFKNNIDRDAWNLKSDSSTNKARKYRSDKSSKINETSTVEPNAGVVRAALYIKNLSVNMPVKISNILCSLMFETPGGELVPMSSFRLRNDDYSLFEVEVYGGSDFGPYVVELTNLNTAEVEKAIAAGYTPKIMIVDYTMTHVADSNYKSSLLNFTGNNLKIVEENAKGRTALVKVYGPGVREMYRVTAFDTPNVSNPCNTKSTDVFSPGISLKKALERISCSGDNITFKDYVIDLSESAPTLAESRVYLKGIQSFGGISTNLPCTDETSTGSDGVSRTACVQKPYSQWTEAEKTNSGVWAIYSKGKFYSPTDYWTDSGSVRRFDPWRGAVAAPVLKGVDSIIWAGDSYDLVYISFKDFIKVEQKFGTNPLETGNGYPINTKWDLKTLGNHPYYPDTNSLFLGEVGFGEKVELKIKLDKTKYLSPNFGTAVDTGPYQYFTNFAYSPQVSSDRYNINQAADFEISLGFGGTRTDWFHIIKDLSSSDPYKLKNCGTTLDFISQTYTLCVQLPTLSTNVDPAISLVKLYIRPALNSAYRKTIWPLHFSQVRKLKGEAGVPIVKNTSLVKVANSYGSVNVGDNFFIQGDSTNYKVVQVLPAAQDGSFDVQLDRLIQIDAPKTTQVYVPGTLTSPDVRLSVDTGFATDWNNFVNSSFNSTAFDQVQYKPFVSSGNVSCSSSPFHPGSCLGFSPELNSLNWMGIYNEGVALWNSWADGGDFSNFLYSGLVRLTAATGKSYRLESTNTDFTISADVNAQNLDHPSIVNHGDVALTVWKQGTTLIGRYNQISTGQALGNPFNINSAASTGNYIVKAKNGKAVIVWENGYNIHASVKDLSTLASVGSEVLVVTRFSPPINIGIGTGFSFSIDVAIGSDKAAIVWNEFAMSTVLSTDYTNPFGWDTNTYCSSYPSNCYYLETRIYRSYTRTIRLDTGALLAATIPVASYSESRSSMTVMGMYFPLYVANYQMDFAAQANNNNQVVIASHLKKLDSQDHTVYGSVYDLATGTRIGTDKTLVSESTRPVDTLQVGAATGRGMILWRRNDGMILGRGIDTSNSNLLGTSNIEVESGSVDSLKLTSFGDRGLLTYRKSNGKDVFLKVLDLQAGQLLYSNGLLLSQGQTNADYRNISFSGSILSGNKILTTWDLMAGTKRTIWGRVSDLSTFTVDGPKEFQISTTNEGVQYRGTAVVDSGFGLVTWLSQDKTQQRIRGYKVDLNNPGALKYGLNNFFVSPLIERDYTVRAKIKY
ncbi:LIC12048 family lipoprotein [Leptospira santarosai]|uniref:LIC12048 family lipoprotein n=1 Tax=Leptospira santarosai TaxID=28183 RepID=UPI0024AF00DD|nr:LIC12048 family lipoprotein [Leptospira santarosai]MDI7175035.1 LIC12048 family lipoprotein [Leptospira santarosai]MDI7194680.1 LIC12048 family lipoprotein [Leptospira santarosai]MDO6399086.1 LIC12048 family lipoprotein [Leptospira santarosai]MDO6404522.1 LIC12048 family lipoprotein [Leptospira santarosai]